MLQTAVSGITSSLTEKVQFLTERDERRERQTTTMKATAARLETQRARANDIGKSDGKNATLARQLDFAENQLAQMDTCRDMLLGLVLDKSAPPLPVCRSDFAVFVCLRHQRLARRSGRSQRARGSYRRPADQAQGIDHRLERSIVLRCL